MKIYDSLSGKEKNLVPIVKNHVGIYTCGITVYDHCHIGHSRSMIFMDIFTRYLRSLGYIVNYVRNVTDIDDKIIRKSLQEGKVYKKLVREFTASMRKHEKLLQVFPPDYEPSVSNYLQEIIFLTKKILQGGIGYTSEPNGVYFGVKKFPAYGRLSHNTVFLSNSKKVEMRGGKSNLQDFALWKNTKIGEPSWDSPWGLGRPGWHIECSAMSMSILGDSFDIHAGGLDLKFPHHENEIAQSESISKKTLSELWMHIGLLKVGGEKMSKSLNNHFSIESVLLKYHPEEIRFFMLSSSYRSPINYSSENLSDARSGLNRLCNSFQGITHASKFAGRKYVAQFFAAMDDDFNTPSALSVLFDISRTVQQLKELGEFKKAACYGETLRKLSGILGILYRGPKEYYHQSDYLKEGSLVVGLLKKRGEARRVKNWLEADVIRKKIKSLGFMIIDKPDGTTSVFPS